MSVTVQDLAQLDPTQVAQFQQLLTQLLAEQFPQADLKTGPLQGLVVVPKAALDTATQTNIDLVRQSSSLLEVAANPTLADPDVVDRLLSNYGMTRGAGSFASGPLTILISALAPVIVSTTAVFTIGGLQFSPDQTYAARTSALNVVNPGDRLLVSSGANYAFTINVVCTTQTTDANVPAGTAATAISAVIPNFVQAFAAAAFTGGAAPESNAQLLARQASGLAAKTWGNRQSVDAFIRSQPAFASLLDESIIGYGDAEMLRDRHTVWPGSLGGRVDVYVQTAPTWQTTILTKTATLVSKVGAVGTWQFSVARDDAPGFYEVDRVLLPGESLTDVGFAASSDVRSYDLTPDATHAYFPDVTTAAEAAYSRYQTATIQFVDTTTDATSLTDGVATATYVMVLRTLPLIDQIQDFLGQRANRPPMSDVLVRAVVPCFTTLSFTATMQAGQPLDTAGCAAAVAAAVNSQGFTGGVAASFISQAVHNFSPAVVSVTAVAIVGRVREPNGTNVSLSSSTAMLAPDDPANMTTANTVIFFLRPQDVTIATA